MRKYTAFLLGSVLIAGAMAATSLYGQTAQQPSGSTMDGGIMMGMMRTMKRMGQMMDHCNNMMSGSRPNEQWRRNSPSQPEQKG
jgi:hypothetical protein